MWQWARPSMMDKRPHTVPMVLVVPSYDTGCHAQVEIWTGSSPSKWVIAVESISATNPPISLQILTSVMKGNTREGIMEKFCWVFHLKTSNQWGSEADTISRSLGLLYLVLLFLGIRRSIRSISLVFLQVSHGVISSSQSFKIHILRASRGLMVEEWCSNWMNFPAFWSKLVG